jgi:hypothetical protein
LPLGFQYIPALDCTCTRTVDVLYMCEGLAMAMRAQQLRMAG